MPLKLSDLEIKTNLPLLPASLPVFSLAAPTLDERRGSIARLGEHLKLGTLRSVELEHGTVLASKLGDITFFHASGAIWARDATATQGTTNELRKWEGQVETTIDGQRTALNADAAKKLIAQTRTLLEPLSLIGKEAATAAVQLDQVAQLDAKGNEIAHGAGQATVKFLYAVDGVPVRGAGAKTLAFAEPVAGQARYSGVFHAWRTIGKAAPVRMTSIDEALGVGVLTDPELEQYRTAGHRIQISRLELVYLALPAFMRQSQLFPAFQVEGTVSEGPRGISFHFGRFHHAVPPQAYAAADLYGPYLTVNPDGISSLAGRQAFA
jgi:hypothetical protein